MAPGRVPQMKGFCGVRASRRKGEKRGCLPLLHFGWCLCHGSSLQADDAGPGAPVAPLFLLVPPAEKEEHLVSISRLPRSLHWLSTSPARLPTPEVTFSSTLNRVLSSCFSPNFSHSPTFLLFVDNYFLAIVTSSPDHGLWLVVSTSNLSFL